MTADSDAALLASICRGLGIPEALASPVLAHAGAVADDASRLGLVSPADIDHVVTRHSADSLLAARARAPKPGERWADIGSGAGFPGLVLGCCYPEASFVLVEPLKKRAGFLEMQIVTLGLGNVRVAPARMEDVEGEFDVCIARAFADPSEAMDRLEARVRPGGTAIVLAGSKAEPPPGSEEKDVSWPGVETAGRIFLRKRPSTSA